MERNGVRKLDADGDVHTSGKVELLEFVNGPCSGVDNVEQALVGADLKLLSGFLVHVNRTVHREFLNPGGKRDRSRDPGASTFCSLHNFLGGAVNGAMIEGAQSDTNFLVFHDVE